MRPMSGRSLSARIIDPGRSLPIPERLSPAPPLEQLVARIDAHSGPGDVVADPFGRGGWVARAALERQRRAVSLEIDPLSRMLAEVVLRPPDVRHLDAAFQGIAASPRGDSSLKLSITQSFATRCPTCGRTLVADEIVWRSDRDGGSRPEARRFRCTVCRDQRGGPEQREAPLDDADLERAEADAGGAAARRTVAERFPPIDGAEHLTDRLLDLHTPRQLAGLAAILARIEGDLRAAPVLAALRLALLHAILPASRIGGTPGRPGTLRVSGGGVRTPGASRWAEREPWAAFEEAFRLVRAFVHRLDAGPSGPVQARLGEDLRSLGEGPATTTVRLATSSGWRALAEDARRIARDGSGPRIRLVLGQPPLRPSLDRLALAYHGTAWVLGREAASLVPSGPLAEASLDAPLSWASASLGRALEALEPAMARDGRVVLLVDGGEEELAATILGAASVGFRLVSARVGEPGRDDLGIVELVPPGAAVPPGPRTRGNVPLPPVPGGPGDPDMVPGTGPFAPPERFDRRPFSAAETGRLVTETAVEVLRSRGEPARDEQLLGEILIGLDRAGHLRRFAAASRPAADEAASDTERDRPAPDDPADEPSDHATAPTDRQPIAAPTSRATDQRDLADPVERLLELVRSEMRGPSQRRLVEVEPGRWWLRSTDDLEGAALPLADRVEWAVFSLLSTAGPLSEAAFFERIATMFGGPDLPDETLVRACLDSYRSRASTTERVVTTDDLLARSHEHTALLAELADGGHRVGMSVWIGEREQARKHDGRPLGALLTERELDAHLGAVSRAPEIADVDCIWYVRNRMAFLWEVEWTAMLGETLRRHARIARDERIVRFLVIAPERTELVRYKLERSPLLRTALEDGPWHIIKAPLLRDFLRADVPDLAALEPLLGLDPVIERSGDQLALFDAEPRSPLG
jgi:hypothetical protein